MNKKSTKKEPKKWIQAIGMKKGALHRELGVKKGVKIPTKKLAAAAKKGGVEGKRARLAETLKSFHHKTKKKVMNEDFKPARIPSQATGKISYKKKAKKMTLKQDTAYDKKHGIKEGSKRDMSQDKKNGIKDKKTMKCKTHKKLMCKMCK